MDPTGIPTQLSDTSIRVAIHYSNLPSFLYKKRRNAVSIFCPPLEKMNTYINLHGRRIRKWFLIGCCWRNKISSRNCNYKIDLFLILEIGWRHDLGHCPKHVRILGTCTANAADCNQKTCLLDWHITSTMKWDPRFEDEKGRIKYKRDIAM